MFITTLSNHKHVQLCCSQNALVINNFNNLYAPSVRSTPVLWRAALLKLIFLCMHAPDALFPWVAAPKEVRVFLQHSLNYGCNV